MTNRRSFLAAGAGAAGLSSFLPAGASASDLKLKAGATILFQGDSITDASRDKKTQKANHARSLGFGYPAHIAGGILRDHASLGLQIHNRGISGNKVPDLDKRWEQDCLELKPAVLSILIGVNDIWHKLNGNYDGTAEVYRDGFHALLERTREALPDTKLVICEPFVLRCGAVNDTWFPDFETRRGYAKEVADKAGAMWVPFQEMFNEAVEAGTKPEYWAADGVHPSVAGHALMAKTWREVVGL
jgi:lysophospholipase L1-like esterase